MKCALSLLLAFCGAIAVLAEVPTAEQYAHVLENRFLNGESAESIRVSFETNGIFTAYDVLPYCYMFEPDTNNLDAAINAFEKKVSFLRCVYSRNHRFMSQDFFDEVLRPFEGKIASIRSWAFRYACLHDGDPSATNLNTRMYLAELDYVRNVDGFINAKEKIGTPRKYVESFLHNNTAFEGRSHELANFAAYGIPLEDIFAELSTNRNVKANENFRHAMYQEISFPSNNILAAERIIRRKNNVLRLIASSCMLKTNWANRALSATYCSNLTNVYNNYVAASPQSLGLTPEEKEEWLENLREAIEIYTKSSPFR